VLNRDQSWDTATCHELAAYHFPEALGGDHYDIHIRRRDDRFVNYSKPVSKEKGLSGAQVRRNLSPKNNWHRRVR
jgi:hypothetical protein